MTVRAHIDALDAAVGDASLGLPPDVFEFVSRMTPLINVDLFIQDDRRRTLLTWRDDEFYGPGWHVPGGIIRFKESSLDRVRACGRDELGAEVAPDPAPLFVYESINPRTTRGHGIALLFRCRLLSVPDPAREARHRPRPGQWRWHDGCPSDLIPEQRPYAAFM